MTALDTSESSCRWDVWSCLRPGALVTIVKLAPDGSEVVRYPGEVVTRFDAESWLVIRAVWAFRIVEVDGLRFSPGDLLLEWFSPELPFNAFALFSPERQFRGWYANVSHPAVLEPSLEGGRPLLLWRDLYLDLVALPNEDFTIRDEDELADSGLEERQPAEYHHILGASEEMQRRFAGAQMPFIAPPELAAILDPAYRHAAEAGIK